MGDWKLHGYNDCPKHTKFPVERPTFEQLIPTKPLGFYKLLRDAKLRVQARMESVQVNILPKDAIVKVVAFRGNRCQIEYGHYGAHWCTVRTALGPLLEICKDQISAKVEYEKNLEEHGYSDYYQDPTRVPADMRLFEEERFRDVAQILVVNYDPWNNNFQQGYHRSMGVKYCFTYEPELEEPPQCEEISEKFEVKQMKKRERTNLTFRHNYNKFGMKNKLSSKNKNVNEGKKQKRRRKVNHFRKHRSQQQQFNSEKTYSNSKKFEQKRRLRKQSCRPETDMSLLEETNDLMFVYV
jgi:hypothetical protein